MNDHIESFVTERLRATRLSAAHFDEMWSLQRDPKVMKTLSADGEILPLEVIRQSLAQAEEHWQQNGFGFWAFHDRSNGQFVGRGGLRIYRIDDRDQVGLAYAVVSNLWGRGYATEMAEASLNAGFGPMGFPEIASCTLPINRPSQRVMEKLGFHYEREIEFAGLTHKYYRLLATDWRKRSLNLGSGQSTR